VKELPIIKRTHPTTISKEIKPIYPTHVEDEEFIEEWKYHIYRRDGIMFSNDKECEEFPFAKITLEKHRRPKNPKGMYISPILRTFIVDSAESEEEYQQKIDIWNEIKNMRD